MRTGFFWRSLARMFVVGFCLVGAVSLRAQQYQAIILPRPAKFVYAYGEGAGNSGRTSGWGIPAGGNYQADVRALLWINTQPPVDITPAGFRAARVDDAEGNQIVGSVSNNPETFSPRAFLWLNGGSAGVLLHPGGDYQFSEADGAGGGQQAGYVYRAFYCAECGRFVFEHAALWSGTRESFVLLHASGADQSRALDTNGARQVGWGFLNKPNTPPYHALLWHGRDSLAVDL